MPRIWKLFARGKTSGHLPNSLHSLERMRVVLERERQRADRGGTGFALLTLNLTSHCQPNELAVVAEVTCGRIRLTDDAGLLGRNQIGIALPETSAAGAWKLASDICDALPHSVRRPHCEVFVYPADVEPREPAEKETRQANVGGRGSRNGRHAAQHESLSQSMQVMFAEPLPLWKRSLDVACAGAALVVAAPLLAVVAVAMKLTSPGPIFYAQLRDGLGGRRFWIYKLRTMIVNADAMKDDLRGESEQDGPAFKLKNDPRVTPLGRLLRRTCIDELPQLFNVLRGDMSLVGPRPMCSREAAECQQWERRRLDVTPGLTCIWQVEGGTKVTFAEWMRMDMRYVRTRSLWRDLKLIVLTVPSIINRDGVY